MDVRDLEVQMDRGLFAEPHEAMPLSELGKRKPLADHADDGVARKVARTDPGHAASSIPQALQRERSPNRLGR